MPRKKIRLPPEGYQGGNCFSVSINTYYRKTVFVDDAAAATGIRSLHQAARRYNARVCAFCFMPDHVHLLAQTPPGTGFRRFVDYFKQSSGLALRDALQTREAIWQPRFYDHGLRSEDGLVAAAEYIFANPVRVGLVAEARDYPYSGSFEWPHVFERASEREVTAVHVDMGSRAHTSEPKGTELHSNLSPGNP